MSDTRYQISETAKLTQVEAHVLRYWEEELQLPIGRNEMGHRYYTEKDIQTFLSIKELKKKGLQLRAIREQLHQSEKNEENEDKKLPDVDSEIKKAVDGGKHKSDKPIKPKEQQTADEKSKEERFGEIMERLIRDVERSERKEGRYRRLDEAIRSHQQSRKMVAATEENTKKKAEKNENDKSGEVVLSAFSMHGY